MYSFACTCRCGQPPLLSNLLERLLVQSLHDNTDPWEVRNGVYRKLGAFTEFSLARKSLSCEGKSSGKAHCRPSFQANAPPQQMLPQDQCSQRLMCKSNSVTEPVHGPTHALVTRNLSGLVFLKENDVANQVSRKHPSTTDVPSGTKSKSMMELV